MTPIFPRIVLALSMVGMFLAMSAANLDGQGMAALIIGRSVYTLGRDAQGGR